MDCCSNVPDVINGELGVTFSQFAVYFYSIEVKS